MTFRTSLILIATIVFNTQTVYCRRQNAFAQGTFMDIELEVGASPHPPRSVACPLPWPETLWRGCVAVELVTPSADTSWEPSGVSSGELFPRLCPTLADFFEIGRVCGRQGCNASVGRVTRAATECDPSDFEPTKRSGLGSVGSFVFLAPTLAAEPILEDPTRSRWQRGSSSASALQTVTRTSCPTVSMRPFTG